MIFIYCVRVLFDIRDPMISAIIFFMISDIRITMIYDIRDPSLIYILFFFTVNELRITSDNNKYI